MSLIIMSKAVDGIVVASDRRETNPHTGAKEDNRKKFDVYKNGVAIGWAAKGQWVEPLIKKNIDLIESGKDAEATADVLYSVLSRTDGLPRIHCLLSDPKEKQFFQIMNDPEIPSRILRPVAIENEPFRCIGMAEVANVLMKEFWKPQYTVEKLADVVKRVMEIVSENNCYVSPEPVIKTLK